MTRYIDETIPKWGTPEKRAKFPPCRLEEDEPQGYLQWHEWARKKSRTHRQVRCREHGLFHIWIPRTTRHG